MSKLAIDNRAAIIDHVRKVGYIDTQTAFNHLGMSGGTLTKVISNLRKGNVSVEKYRARNTFNGRLTTQYIFDVNELI